MKPEEILEWVKSHGVEAASWVYPKRMGHPIYVGGPAGISLQPVGGKGELFVPIRAWRFIKNRIRINEAGKPSMFVVA
jgi:hypothetical protein